jgi:hypothetical protein
MPIGKFKKGGKDEQRSEYEKAKRDNKVQDREKI